MAALHDPCPLPDKQKKRSLNERERLLYAPMSGRCTRVLGGGQRGIVGGGRRRKPCSAPLIPYAARASACPSPLHALLACQTFPTDVGGLLFDKDAVYIDIPDWKVRGAAARPGHSSGGEVG